MLKCRSIIVWRRSLALVPLFQSATKPTKQCMHCGRHRPVDSFPRSRRGGPGYRTFAWCFRCMRLIAVSQGYYLYATARAGPCVDCGKQWPAVAMDLHHVRGPKVSSVSALVRSRAPIHVISAEIAKCVLLCACCHRLRRAMELESPKKNKHQR